MTISLSLPMVPTRGTQSSLSTIVQYSKMMIKLTGKTNHGKNRVREHGDLWEVLEVPTGVLSMTHKPPFPPIKSVKTGEERWLDDANFSWIPSRFQLTNPISYGTIRYSEKQRGY